ncbi:MAG: helix-turn-helix domain-containing protein [Bacilli bacterium]
MKNNLNTKIEFEKNRSEIAHYIYHQDDINLNFESHLHFSFEILYVEEGQLEATIDNRFFSINSHQAIIIFPNQIHCYRTKQYSKSHLVIFGCDLVANYYQHIKSYSYLCPIIDLKSVDYLTRIKEENNIYLNKGYAYQLVSFFDSVLILNHFQNKDDSIVSYLIEFIKENYSQPISLKSLAKEKGYSYNYLSRIFNDSIGVNFLRFVNLYRIELATILLSTDKPITEIALECGFSNVRSFNREFVSIKKINPSQFRKDHKK